MIQQQLLGVALAQHGQRLTKPRQFLFDVLLKNHAPLTMRQLIHLLPEVDRASVYRSIALFEELGIVKRIWIGFKSKIELSDKFTSHHHHLSCLACGKVKTITDSDLEKILKKIAQSHNLSAETHQVEINGYCQSCFKLKLKR